MSDAYQELPGAATLDERAASIPKHVERIMFRDYAPVNEGFHILYDASELLRRYAKRIEALEAHERVLVEAIKIHGEACLKISDRIRRGANNVPDHQPINDAPAFAVWVGSLLADAARRAASALEAK